ncbi:dynamin family protein [Microbulbifer thermotolerans]|uniref:dynamin family protein n=1 Tax=Microbulbifer thermotolerans TaxID=252514 RepID=UPI00267414A0|nr:dynamin family protein [Microbulbifer thermotolerans]WKT60791.1 dynamin family protein [Microbulbifer thermotolerans]
MEDAILRQHIADYDRWKKALDHQFASFNTWLREHFPNSAGARQVVQQARALLAEDQFTLALVGEFSRGKTELINALLSDTYGKRLLPSKPGRTTMCPTEIFSDGGERASLRLLPIETLATNTSLESFRRIPQKWVTHEFDADDPDATREALAKVAASKSVTPEEAARYGFDRRHLDSKGKLVEIPAWRYALICLPHPLLAQGLRIIDTPGLNALGNEPELTLSTLPSAQAVAFLLAADAGVSGTDLNMWETHLVPLREHRDTTVMALLNKVDVLWDDPDEDAEMLLRRMRAQVAKLLALPQESVVGVSAKKALLARSQGDQELLQASRFPEFESLLVQRLMEHRQKMAENRSLHQALTLMADTRDLLKRRLNSGRAALGQLQRNSAANGDQLAELAQLQQTVREQHKVCHQELLTLKSSQRMLSRQRASLLAPISSQQLQSLIDDTSRALHQRWTPLGLAKAIDGFMEGVDHQLSNLEREVAQVNRLLDAIFERANLGEKEAREQHFSIHKFRIALRGLHRQAAQLRRSPQLLLARRNRLTERFIATLASEVGRLYSQLISTADGWLDQALEPLKQHVQYQKHLLNRHLIKLTELKQKTRNKRSDLRTLEEEVLRNESALAALEELLRQSSAAPQPLAPAPKPHNVTPLKKVPAVH